MVASPRATGAAIVQSPMDVLDDSGTEAEPDEIAAPADLEAKLDLIPPLPGVYLLRDRHAKVVYVGKAKSLRARVRSYFRGGDGRHQVRFLVQRVTDIETLVTANDKEALILENNLIKQYKPRYNIRLKDDKSYVSVKVTTQDAWPRILVTRKIVKDGSRYFGPFHSASAVRETLDTIRKVIPLRTCSDGVFRNRSRPCLEFQIKRCLAPCCLPVDPEEYRSHLRQAVLMLEGKGSQLVRQLRDDMDAAADDLRFEEAARLRDRIQAIEKTQERQQALTHWGADQDVFGLYREGGFIEVQVLFVRSGKLTGNQAYSLQDLELPDEEVLEQVLTQFYQGERYAPDEILLPIQLEDAEVRADYLSERKGKRVEVLWPQRGDKVRLVQMAAENARLGFLERQDADDKNERMMQELKDRLHLRSAPKRIECFDIATIQGSHTVASMVTFDEGEPDKNRYRRFRVKTVVGTDDFASMYEVLKRRFERAKRDDDYPDLLVVDGGMGQLNVALAVLRELEIDGVDAVGLAKMRAERAPMEAEVRHSEERVFLPNRKNPVVLRRNSNALWLLQRVRDEAHRFANTYHQELRKRETIHSLLDSIPGVGPARRRRLLRSFGSVKRIREAAENEIAQVRGISVGLARKIKRALAAEEGTLDAS
jgi:excinuclease ABC subunit C